MQTEELEAGYLALGRPGRLPGIVMIHDVWGLADHTRDMARRLAGEGYAVLAVNLYRRMPTVKIDNPGTWMRELSDPHLLDEIQAAIDLLHARPEASGKVGITGFCMGGMYVLMAACHCRGLSAAVPFYGLLSHRTGLLYDAQGLDPARKPREPLAMAPGLRCPLLAFFGEDDEFIRVDDVRALEAALGKSAQPSQVVLYPEAGHAFMNDTRPAAYRPEVARDAWGRMLRFFAANLR
ncbi:MAG TPA: dienelactone hydrolase family protein [Myxococcota bacterium]|nr:dienelactone hydrolase family protein [Myxococcota bacterium]